MISQLQPSTFAEFRRQTEHGNLVAVTRTIAGAAVNPVDAFVSIAAAAPYAFLFESVEGKENVANYSFLGADPYMIVRGRGQLTTIERNGKTETLEECVPDFLRRHFFENKLADSTADQGPLAGGAVGFFGYGAANWFEPALNRTAPPLINNVQADETDEALLMFYRTLVTLIMCNRRRESSR